MKRAQTLLLLGVGTTLTAPAQGDWITHTGPGYTVEHPPGWSVTEDFGTGLVSLTEPGGARAYILPFCTEGTPLSEGAARSMLEQRSAQFLPQAPWGPVTTAGSTTMRRVAQDDTGRAMAILECVNGEHGSAGTQYYLYAPGATASQLEPSFARILGSFHPARIADYVRWSDPMEGAFTVEVPEGWIVQGGTLRVPGGRHGEVEMTSPDGAVFISSGDDYPEFLEPSNHWAQQGISEGGQVTVPYTNIGVPVRRYMPGAQFITEWFLPSRAAAGEVLEIRDRSDLPLVQTLNRLHESSDARANAFLTGGGSRLESVCNAGEVDYTLERDGRRMHGRAFALTQRQSYSTTDYLHGATNISSWKVITLIVAEAPEDRLAEALAHVARLVQSLEINPQWLAAEMRMQAQAAAERSRIIRETQQEISDIISEVALNRANAMDRAAAGWSAYIRGTGSATDPRTGQQYEVESGHGYYWISADGSTYTTTDTEVNPDPTRFSQMLEPD
jgi:hypothetical protein